MSPYCCVCLRVWLLLQAFLRHKNVLITPALLHKEGIPFVKVSAVHGKTPSSSVVQQAPCIMRPTCTAGQASVVQLVALSV